MANLPPDMVVSFDMSKLDEIVNVKCRAMNCVNHVFNSASCNLKHISIGAQGSCIEFEPRLKVEAAVNA